jgi:hypothetical protein
MLFERKNKVVKFGRNPGGARVGMSNRITEIATNMEEIIWVGVSRKKNSKIEMCVSFIMHLKPHGGISLILQDDWRKSWS